MRWTTFDAPDFGNVMATATLCINCTSVGMHPQTETTPLKREFLHEGMTVLDTVYNPLKTVLLRLAEETGCKAQNGLRMLVYQGLASQRYWIGKEIEDSAVDIEEIEREIVGKA